MGIISKYSKKWSNIVKVPDNCSDEIKINTEGDIKLKIGNNCKVKILEESNNNEVSLEVGKNSEVKYITIHKKNSNKVAEIGENSKIIWIDLCLERIKSSTVTNLNGVNSKCNSFGVIFGDGEKEFNIDNKVIHKGNESKSDMFARIVLTGSSKALYNGLVRVNKNAVKCEGYQKSEVILLSDKAYAEAIPNLEIENNDVKCSHGATISQIDEDKLFYMTSRGINEKDAKRVIIEGFFEPIIVNIDEDELRDEMQNIISERIKTL